MTTHKCHWCGDLFKDKRSVAKYCSQKCAKTARRTRVGALCRRCGSAFDYAPSQRTHYRGAGQFCSRACAEQGPVGECAVCGAAFQGYRDNQRFCSPKCRTRRYVLFDDVERRAWSMAANLIGYPERQAFFTALLRAALGQPCPYCEVELTLANVSLDHKEPVHHPSRRDKAATKEQRIVGDRPANLHIVCRDCNQLKGNLSDGEYRALLLFFTDHPSVAQKVTQRMRQGNSVWAHKRDVAKARA